jgi:UV radiation resistance-associated gene protein
MPKIQLDSLQTALPLNAVVFHMTDGIYSPPTSLAAFRPQFQSALPKPNRSMSSRTLSTSSFDALLRLAKLDDSIQDALATRNKLASDLESLLFSHKTSLDERDKLAEATDRLKTIEFASQLVKKQVTKAETQIAEKRSSLEQRRQLMSSDKSHRNSQYKEMQNQRPDLPAFRTDHNTLDKAIHAQRRRITTDLSTVYPLSPLPNQSLAFKIRDLHLPNSDILDSSEADVVAAALGYVAHAVQMLSHYLRSPLTYPVEPRASSSTIFDGISKLPTNASTTHKYEDEIKLRTYPLFSKGVPRFRFEYGVFLLNKDIQILLESVHGVKVVDLRQTLPNLAYLFYVGTAGEGELPARKAGGVRGLVNMRMDGAGGRSGSVGSIGSMGSGMFKKVVGKGKDKEANGRLSAGDTAVESLRRNMGPKK